MATIPTVINGIACNELVSEFAEGIGDRGPWARKGYICAWTDRFTLANGMLGLSSHVGGPGGPITITRPYIYPESSNLYAREIDIQGVGKPFQGPKQLAWDFAIVRVNFGVPTWGAATGDDPFGSNSIDPGMPFIYATQELDFSTEWVTIPAKDEKGKSALKFGNGNPMHTDWGFQLARADMSITLHKFPWMPAQAIMSALTKQFNDAIFLNCEIGKCRFNGAKLNRTASADGTFTQDLAYSFSYRPIAPWDYAFDPESGSWQRVLSVATGNPLATYSDLTVLFPPPYWSGGEP